MFISIFLEFLDVQTVRYDCERSNSSKQLFSSQGSVDYFITDIKVQFKH